jgi:hypothetical protein
MKWYGFLAGWLSYGAITSISQDMMGKAEYLRRTEACWVTWYISVPIAAVALVLSYLLLNKVDKEN